MNKNRSYIQTGIKFLALVIAAAITAAAGCSKPQLTAPANHRGSDAEWRFFRGNGPGATGTADEAVEPPLAEKWSFKAGDAVRSSPAVADGVVVFGSQDGNVYALDSTSGEELWKYRTGDIVTASPLIHEGTVFIGSLDGEMYVLDLRTGVDRFQRTAGSMSADEPGPGESLEPENAPGADPYEKYMESGKEIETGTGTGGGIRAEQGIKGGAATDGEKLYFGALDRKLYAVDLDTMKIEWTFQAGDWFEGVPAVVNGVVYIGSNDGYLYAIDTDDGSVLWMFETGNCVYSTPAIVEGTLFFTSWDGNVYALDITGLEPVLKWKTRIDDQVSASPAAAGGKVFVGGAFEGDFVALDAESGEVLWKMPTKGGFDAGAVVSGDIVYVGSYDMHLYALDAATGKVLWKNMRKHWVRGSVAVADNTVFCGDGNGVLTAFVTAE